MNDSNQRAEIEKQAILQARQKGRGALLGTYFRLSGPGWLQSALTLGGGSLASSLYLGVLGGLTLLWLQPLAIMLGIIMLGAIGYVTLSTGERPFDAIRKHVNPVLAWGWAAATLLANMVWSLPQYALATGVVQQNLLPNLLGADSAMGDFYGKVIVVSGIFISTTAVTLFYGGNGPGVRIYEFVLKIVVAVIVACFLGVVIKLSLSGKGMDWGRIVWGFVPNFSTLWKPAYSFAPLLESITDERAHDFWTNVIVQQQQNVMIAAAANAVGINMTFLLPYSMLSRGWNKDFRGLAFFDLSTGTLIPFVLATSCVLLASASQFHTVPAEGLLDDTGQVIADAGHPKYGQFTALLDTRSQTLSEDAIPITSAERIMAATLVKRDAADLAKSLSPLTGDTIANWVFGCGVIGMTLSSITLLMLISGFVICETFGFPHNGWQHRVGTLCAATGILGPFFWTGKTVFWLAVPTSVFNYVLLPIAYLTFFAMMNSKSLLGEYRPSGAKRVLWNTLMGIATTITTLGAVWMAYNKAQWYGIGAIAIFVLLTIIAQVFRKPKVNS